jgi:penicillin-binding protein 2B
MTSIANKGIMMQPYVIDKIVNPNTGEVITDHKPTEKKSPISAKTADQVKEILASTVTSEHGTAKRFKLNEYTTAGKTGTAQIAKPGGGYYWGSNFFLYSFLGMAPVEDPKLIVYVAVHKPQLEGSEVGSEPTSEIFKSVVENSLKYLNIQPENLELASPIKMPNVVGKNVIESQSLLESQGLKTVIIGQEEQVREQFPAEGTSMLASGTVFVKGDGEIQLPNFTGWSKRNLMIFKSLSKVPIEIVGEGFVTSQSLTAGSAVSANTPVVVHLSTPKELETQSEVKQNMETSSQD